MRLAALDLGTNTFLLLIADFVDGQLEPVYQEQEIVRLGQGVDRDGRLHEEAMARGLACLQRYAATAGEYGAAMVAAGGTSAVRDAGNRDDFISRVMAETGIRIYPLSGDDEARLSYLGALSNRPEAPTPACILDIGGGSTELCWGEHHDFHGRFSLNIGSVRLTERYLHHDPVTAAEITRVRQAIAAAWENAGTAALPTCKQLIGVAGTLTTLSAVQQGLREFDSARIDGSELSLRQVSGLVARFAGMTVAERKQLPGLPEKRADVILAGTIIIEEIMQRLQLGRITVSDRGLRFGIALACAHNQWPLEC